MSFPYGAHPPQWPPSWERCFSPLPENVVVYSSHSYSYPAAGASQVTASFPHPHPQVSFKGAMKLHWGGGIHFVGIPIPCLWLQFSGAIFLALELTSSPPPPLQQFVLKTENKKCLKKLKSQKGQGALWQHCFKETHGDLLAIATGQMQGPFPIAISGACPENEAKRRKGRKTPCIWKATPFL